MARRRRKVRAHKTARRHKRRSNPIHRIRRRRVRKNPDAAASLLADVKPSGGSVFARARVKPRKARGRRKGRKVTAAARRRRSSSKKLLGRVRALRKRAKGLPKRSLRRSVLTTQAHRLSTLRRVALKGRKVTGSPVYKAMHIKSNPGMAGLMVAAKALLPQVGVGAVSMVGLAVGGKKLSGMLTHEAAVGAVPGAIRKAFQNKADPNKLNALGTYAPAISTAALAVGGYMLANKFAPKYKGAVVLGGLLGAAMQAIAAAAITASSDSLAGKAKTALLGDYTTVGGRSYAEGGMFREIGDYTTVGGAYSTGRPRASRDNATEWAVNGLGDAYSMRRPRLSADNATEWSVNGLDDSTEFAPGEGGVLSGGMFRGSST